jgi:hypothetical protein
METLEIKYVRKLLIPLVTVMTIIIISSAAYTLFWEHFKNNNTGKYLSLAATAFAAYILYGSWRLILANKPALVFHENFLEISRGKNPLIFNWSEIAYWKIEKIDDNGNFLFIEKADQKEKISLNWLEKPPEEIEKLMRIYTSPKTI